MTPYLLASTLFVLVFAAAATRAADPPRGPIVAAEITATRNCQTQLGVPRSAARSPWKHHSRGYWEAELNRWKLRHAACSKALHRRAFEWNWQQWMPAHWQRLAQCEEAMDWHHYGGGYEGAFAFAYSTWDQFKYPGYPESAANASPWQQWQVARRVAAHYHSIAGSWGCWRGPQHAWVRGGLSESGTWQ